MLLLPRQLYDWNGHLTNRPTSNAQNPLHTFPRDFPVDGEAADLLRTC